MYNLRCGHKSGRHKTRLLRIAPVRTKGIEHYRLYSHYKNHYTHVKNVPFILGLMVSSFLNSTSSALQFSFGIFYPVILVSGTYVHSTMDITYMHTSVAEKNVKQAILPSNTARVAMLTELMIMASHLTFSGQL